MIQLEISAASRVGCVRENNEDMILVGDCFIRNDEFHAKIELQDKDRYMMAVADGMGGHNRGEIASSLSLHNLQFFFNDIPYGMNAGDFNESIIGWLDSANHILESKGLVDLSMKGMGTTLVAFAYYDGDFYSLNCGDSRLYRLRDGQLKQLTNDHSLDNMMGEAKHTSIITNCIGGGCKTSYIDIVQMTNDIRRGDVYLLCSDGLTDMVSDHRLEILLQDGVDADKLCDAAIERGGLDNVSACRIDVKLLL